MMNEEIKKLFLLSPQEIETLQHQKFATLEERERVLQEYDERIASFRPNERFSEILRRTEAVFETKIRKIEQEESWSLRQLMNAQKKFQLLKNIDGAIETFLQRVYQQSTAIDFARDVINLLTGFIAEYDRIYYVSPIAMPIKPSADSGNIQDISPKRRRHIAGRTVTTKIFRFEPNRGGILQNACITQILQHSYWENYKIIFAQTILRSQRYYSRHRIIGWFSSADDIQWLEERLRFSVQRARLRGFSAIIQHTSDDAIRRMLESAALQIFSGVL